MKILITGGCGFIGSTVASAALDAGITPVILDNLATGRREFVHGRPFYQGDIADGALIDRIFADHPDIRLALHSAALIASADSVTDPMRYYQENVVKSVDLVGHLLRNRCHRLIFSSSASIYRPGADLCVDEDSALDPLSPYARTKAITENLLSDVAAATALRVLSLRYFNPIGADPMMRTGPQLSVRGHLLTNLLDAYHARTTFAVAGTDYPTRDGSGLRDYLHVWDLARAHVRALTRFDDVCHDGRRSVAVNLGTGVGTTVLELVNTFNHLVRSPVPVMHVARRPGDTVGAFSRSRRAETLLGWRPHYTLAEALRHTLAWSEASSVSALDS